MTARVAELLVAAPAVRACREALGARDDAWFVGGAIRDALFGREVRHVDFVVGSDEQALARGIGRMVGGPAFPLSEEFEAWRVMAAGGEWHVDVVRMRGDRIEADLALRDFTVNAIASPAADVRAPLLDPHGGQQDVERKLLRVVSQRSFADDPLRLLRAARIAATFGLKMDDETLALGRAEAPRAGEPAGERQFAELRLILTGPDPVRGLALLDELQATTTVLPELEALRGVEQNPYHHLDVHGHTIEVLSRVIEVEAGLSAFAGPAASEAGAVLDEPLADELTRADGLRFAALFHDLGKPSTRTVGEAGRVLFIGHDRAGARIVRALCTRLRTSRRLADYLANLTLNHLRLGFLVHAQPLSRRHVYDYLLATSPDSVDVTLLTVADRLATQGQRTSPEAVTRHLELARTMLGEAVAWRRQGPPRPPIRGDDLAAELEIEPGPELGRLLGEIEAAVFAGEVSTREDAIELARGLA
jgi:putative nucleotidyltransferase with HDIG domain